MFGDLRPGICQSKWPRSSDAPVGGRAAREDLEQVLRSRRCSGLDAMPKGEPDMDLKQRRIELVGAELQRYPRASCILNMKRAASPEVASGTAASIR